MQGKIPPHSIEAERSALGAALLNKDALADVIEVVKEGDFYDSAHREIFSAMKELYTKQKAVDFVTVAEELKRRKTLEASGGRSYVGELSSNVPSAVNAKEYATIVAEKAALRNLISTSDEIRESCFEDKTKINEIMDNAEKKILKIAQTRQKSEYTPIKDILMKNLEKIDELSKLDGDVVGLTTGFKALDKITSGFNKSELIIVAARPAMGKTAFVLNIAQNAAKKAGASVLIFNLEMDKESLSERMLAMEARVEMEKLKRGNLDRPDWERVYVAVDELSKSKIMIDDTPGQSIFDIKNKCRRMKAENGLDLVVVDYLQLMTGDAKNDNRQQVVADLSRQFKLLAREMECPVVLLSQLSRATEQRPDKRPMLSDLRESGAIEQDADIVMFLYRDEYYNEDTEKPGICEVNIAKHRSGPTGTIDLTWIARYTKFADVAQG